MLSRTFILLMICFIFSQQKLHSQTLNWVQVGTMPEPRSFFWSFEYNSKLYIVGGVNHNASVNGHVDYAEILINHELGNWISTSPITTDLYQFGSGIERNNGFIYVAGGQASGPGQNVVLYSQVQGDGSINTWQQTMSMPNGRRMQSGIVHNNYLYQIGGQRGSIPKDSVFYSVINSDGTLDNWQETSILPTPLYGTVCLIYNNFIYVLGGKGTNISNKVYFAVLNSDGTLGTWNSTTNLITPLYLSAGVTLGNKILITGGYDINSNVSQAVFIATINIDGTLGAWTQLGNLPVALASHQLVHFDDGLFLSGGENGSSYQNQIYYSSLDLNSLMVLQPNGGENWQIGQSYDIEWSDNISENVKIELFKGGTFNREISSSTPSNGLFSWNIPGDVVPGNDYKIKITSVTNSSINDSSDNNFTIYLSQSITVNQPNGGEDWPIGSPNKIIWTAPNVNQVKIEYSTDNGNSWILITTTQGSLGEYNWTVPEMPSSNCKVRVSDYSNPTIYDISNNVFTITYYLFRVLNDGSYEKFEMNKHSWRFENDETNSTPPFNGDPIIWPEYWWTQFNYSNYPLGPEKAYIFPDWSLWVDVFTEAQCYLNPPPGITIYRQKAVEKWKFYNDEWKGSCFGFAISTFLAFDDSASFKFKFPDFPGWLTRIRDNLFWGGDIERANKIRKTLNNLFTHQFGKSQLQHKVANKFTSVDSTVSKLKQMLKSTNRDDKILVIIKQDSTAGHALNPFRIQVGTSIDSIFVYDSNREDAVRFILIDKLNNEWVYPYGKFQNYTSNWGLFLMDPVSNYISNPILDLEDNLTIATDSSNYFEFYNSKDSDIRISNSIGQYIGIISGSFFDTMNEGIPIIPFTSQTSNPIGYYLPKDTYNINIMSNDDTISYFSVFTDSIMMKFSRENVEPLQEDRIRLDSVFCIINPQAISKEFSFDILIPDSTNEKSYKIESINNSDSVAFDLIDLSNLKFYNFGSDKNYKIDLRYADQNREDFFQNNEISIPQNSSHLIIPEWDSIATNELRILVDVGNDGTIDDTIEVINQISSVSDWINTTIPSQFQLYQNFPNPYNPTTSIRYSVPKEEMIILTIYNTLGEEVTRLVNEVRQKGNYEVIFDARDLPSGIYFYRLQAGSFVETKKMVLIK
jgi:N-acetylneuraminic acid mutarotase